MKTKLALGQLLLVAILFSSSAPSELTPPPKKPKCTQMTQEDWKLNFDQCSIPWGQAVAAGKMTNEEVNKLCTCQSNKMIYELSCALIKQMNSDLDFGMKKGKEILNACAKEYKISAILEKAH